MSKKPAFHGSDLEKVAAYYHIPEDSIINFGANVNPLGLPDSLRSELIANIDIICRYPDPAYKKLRETIAAYTGADADHILVGNGSTELISLVISTRHSKRALLVGPTYSEYQRDLELTGGTIESFHLDEGCDFRLDADSFCQMLKNRHATAAAHNETTDDLLIICNPNNPTSSAIPVSSMEVILDTCRELGIFVMIDETYIEFAPNPREICAIPFAKTYDNFMVLRGVSKFFSAPGLRFGYGITGNADMLRRIKEVQNPWSLNSLAAFAGTKMFTDHDFISRTKDFIETQRTLMMQALKKIPQLKVYPAYANFILVKILDEKTTSFDVFDFLIRKSLMVRDCSSFSALEGQYFRFCIMNPEDNQKLLQGIQEFFSK